MKPEIKVWFVWKAFPLPECYVGEMTKIHWSVKNISRVNIEFTTDEGYSWQPIASNISGSSEDLNWQIPNTPSSQCYIAAYDSKNPLIRDVWDYNFWIYPTVTSVEDILIHEFRLEQNFPNPFNPTTTITYSIPEISHVQLIVYDVLGTEVSTLVNEVKATGNYEVKFSADGLSSGIYFYKLQTQEAQRKVCRRLQSGNQKQSSKSLII
ncbi:MAG: T9SS C-terminal target domain-containing protein, partial [Ignavibacteriales bacterium]